MDLPPVDSFNSILVVVDQGLTKGVILIPCEKMITAEGMAKLLLENLYKRFGLPDKIISDQGPQFASKVFVELLKLLGINRHYRRHIIHRQMGQPNGLIKKLKLTWGFTVLHIQKNG